MTQAVLSPSDAANEQGRAAFRRVCDAGGAPLRWLWSRLMTMPVGVLLALTEALENDAP